ncbi:MAG: bacteriorhodopsin [Halobacteriales archaeon]
MAVESLSNPLVSGSLWVGTALMTLGTLYFVWLGKDADESYKEFFVITIFITAIAAANYLSMALGFGVTTLEVESAPSFVPIAENGSYTLEIFWARYSDWLFTTPLLLLDIALLVKASKETIATLIGLDVYMILTGLAATMSQVWINRIVWWAVSTGALLALLYILVGSLSRKADEMGGDTASLFSTLRNIVIVLWLAYPVVWLIGSEGAALIGLGPETAIFAVLDVLAKVGFGFVLLRSRNVLEDVTSGGTEAV